LVGRPLRFVARPQRIGRAEPLAGAPHLLARLAEPLLRRLAGRPGQIACALLRLLHELLQPPEAFREDILDAMKKEKPPAPYKDQVKRYYEELVK
ncbi:MAG TPA: hypothetical protein VKE22_09930, partial [Haliangiales bacterium]|nr:hypothetical protein [Haliangiales bacterium]